LQVFVNNVFDYQLSLCDYFISGRNVPQMGLVSVGDLVISTRNIVNFLNHCRNNFDEFISNLGQLVLETDLVTVDLKFQSEKSVLEVSVGIILTRDDFFRGWVSAVFLLETAEEVNVVVN